MTQQDIAIRGEPVTAAMCRFTVDRPVYPGKAFFFGNEEQAEGSAFAERIFAIAGVKSVLVSDNQVTVHKTGTAEWPVIGKQIGNAIREFLGSGESVIDDNVLQNMPSADTIREGVQRVIDEDINPSVAGHGGVVRLIDVVDNVVYIQMGGGCQGCGQADVTLKYGIETSIRGAVAGVGEILDVTYHASGRNPYYVPSKK